MCVCMGAKDKAKRNELQRGGYVGCESKKWGMWHVTLCLVQPSNPIMCFASKKVHASRQATCSWIRLGRLLVCQAVLPYSAFTMQARKPPAVAFTATQCKGQDPPCLLSFPQQVAGSNI